jgi:hypothetical protein
MLELRPTCEHCNRALPPESLEAQICSYERTFCVACVEQVLGNVCPNCGGGFAPRPIRPSTNWNGDNSLGKDPTGTTGWIKGPGTIDSSRSQIMRSDVLGRHSLVGS